MNLIGYGQEETPLEQASKKSEFEKLYNSCFIDLNKKPKRPDPVITIGSKLWNGKSYPNEVMTIGEMSAISAPSKSYKTYLKSHFASAFLKNSFCNHISSIKGHRQDNWGCIDIDTEQGEFYAWNAFNRAKQLTGINEIPFYYPFKLRHLDPTQRVYFIDQLIKSGKLEHEPKLIFVDGIADLVDDSNDLVMSNEIATKVMQWTDIYKCHVCTIIHNAYGTKKPTGHLGSVVVKKAETVISLIPERDSEEKPTGIVTAHHQYSRGASFEDFQFQRAKDADHLEEVTETDNAILDENIF